MNEIASALDVTKSTAYSWTKEVQPSSSGARRILNKKRAASSRGRKRALAVKKQRRQERGERHRRTAQRAVEALPLGSVEKKVICAALFWAEGETDVANGIRFANSDPMMVKTFLQLLRDAYPLDETRFRVLLHLHDYHDSATQVAYWSQVTKIPKKQFHKSYKKPHTKIRKREGYQGCASIRYADVRVARELEAIYKELGSTIGD